jgi:hypothetical protein
VPVIEICVLATVDNGAAQTTRETGFIVDPATVAGEVGDNEFRIANRGDDFVRNLVIVLLNLKFFARRDDSRRHGPQADLAAAGWCGRSSEC